jgi:hypothetical protein
MKTQLRYRVCDEDGTLRKFATKTEATHFMGCRKDLILQVDKKQKAPTEPAADLYAFGEAAF